MMIILVLFYLIVFISRYLFGAFIIIPILSAIDISLTYATIVLHRKYNPDDKKWDRLELNGVVKWFWKKFGLRNGTILAAIPIILMWSLIGITTQGTSSDYIFGIFAGIYIMVNFTHIFNLKTIFKQYKVKVRKLDFKMFIRNQDRIITVPKSIKRSHSTKKAGR